MRTLVQAKFAAAPPPACSILRFGPSTPSKTLSPYRVCLLDIPDATKKLYSEHGVTIRVTSTLAALLAAFVIHSPFAAAFSNYGALVSLWN